MTAYTDSEKYKQDVRNAVSKYNSKLASITIRIPKEMKAEFYEAAEKAGIPFKRFFIQAMQEKIDRM